MCPQDTNVQNAVISRGVLRMSAFGADVINSRNITPEARKQAEVKLLTAKNKIQTIWCGKCGAFRRTENGTCAECNKVLAAQYKASQQTPAKIGLLASLIAEGYKQQYGSRYNVEYDVASEYPCKLCGKMCYAIILVKGNHKRAISRCTGCANEYEF